MHGPERGGIMKDTVLKQAMGKHVNLILFPVSRDMAPRQLAGNLVDGNKHFIMLEILGHGIHSHDTQEIIPVQNIEKISYQKN
jgi:hypothetical protein